MASHAVRKDRPPEKRSPVGCHSALEADVSLSDSTRPPSTWFVAVPISNTGRLLVNLVKFDVLLAASPQGRSEGIAVDAMFGFDSISVVAGTCIGHNP